jgi:hypothetical protein
MEQTETAEMTADVPMGSRGFRLSAIQCIEKRREVLRPGRLRRRHDTGHQPLVFGRRFDGDGRGPVREGSAKKPTEHVNLPNAMQRTRRAYGERRTCDAPSGPRH